MSHDGVRKALGMIIGSLLGVGLGMGLSLVTRMATETETQLAVPVVLALLLPDKAVSSQRRLGRKATGTTCSCSAQNATCCI